MVLEDQRVKPSIQWHFCPYTLSSLKAITHWAVMRS